MKKIKYLSLCLIGFSLGFISCNKEESEFIEEPTPDPYDTIEFYSIEYDFDNKEINNLSLPEFKESFENNSDRIVPITLYPYSDQGMVDFSTEESENILDGLEFVVPVPIYENDSWSESETMEVKTSFGKIMNFNPSNGNISFTIEAEPWNTLRYGYVLTFSELIVPFEAVFVGSNYGDEYKCSGILTMRVPIYIDIKIEE